MQQEGRAGLLTSKSMAAERARAADPQPLGDALGVELVPAQRTRHHADLLAVHEIPEADATL